MHKLEAFLRIIDITNDWIGKVISYLVIPFALLVSYEVIQRYVFKTPSLWIEEGVLLGYGAYIILGGAYAFIHNTHVNVDIFYRRWSPKTKAIVDAVTFPLFVFFVGMLLWKGGDMALTSLQHMEHSQSAWRPPIYPFKLIVPLAAFLLLLQGLAKFIRNITTITAKREAK